MKRRGFTLLEVMVAVAILGLSLTVILSAQTGLYSSSTYAQHSSVAVGLARCRMTEIEQKLLKFGYPEIDQNDEGPCCEDDSQSSMKCKWKIEKIELPVAEKADLTSFLGGAADGGAASGGGALSPLTAMADITKNPGSITDGGIAGLASGLGQGMGGVDGIASMVMALVYPQLKPMLEASIRKVSVSVVWREGLRERDLSIVQYVTYPAKAALVGPDGLPVDGGAAPVPTFGFPSGRSSAGAGMR